MRRRRTSTRTARTGRCPRPGGRSRSAAPIRPAPRRGWVGRAGRGPAPRVTGHGETSTHGTPARRARSTAISRACHVGEDSFWRPSSCSSNTTIAARAGQRGEHRAAAADDGGSARRRGPVVRPSGHGRPALATQPGHEAIGGPDRGGHHDRLTEGRGRDRQTDGSVGRRHLEQVDPGSVLAAVGRSSPAGAARPAVRPGPSGRVRRRAGSWPAGPPIATPPSGTGRSWRRRGRRPTPSPPRPDRFPRAVRCRAR